MKSSISSLLLIVYLFFVFLSLVGAFFISPYCLFFTAMLIALCINHFLLRKVLSPLFLPRDQQGNKNILKGIPGLSSTEFEKFSNISGNLLISFCIICDSIMPVAIAFGFFQISVSQNLPEFYGYSVTSFIIFFSLLSIFIDFVIILLIKAFLLALALLGKVLQFIWEKFFKRT
ncbi:MAG: hypothetical protein FWH46_00880 [Methanimicrococcus sp.]|nr:hypothetical protein [Methanimicrococcus sp.]